MNLAIPPILGGSHGVSKVDTLKSKTCKSIIDLHKTSIHTKGKVQVSDSDTEEKIVSIRQVDAWRIHQKETWVDELLVSHIRIINEELYEYNLSGLIERPQLLRYNAGSIGYDWHVDIEQEIPNINGQYLMRKLSMTIWLNDPDEYEGGEFDIEVEGPRKDPRYDSLKLPKGSVVVFPSRMWHRVRPITSGERKSLVVWFRGVPFR